MLVRFAFKNILILLSLFYFTSSIAQAGGSFEELPAEWTGMYAGIHLGYTAEANLDGVFDSAELRKSEQILLDELSADGAEIGVNIGHLWQRGKFVYGIEADISMLDAEYKDEDDEEDLDGQDTAKLDFNYLASLRARAGLASNELYIYATGGLAYINADYTVTNSSSNDDEFPRPAVGSGSVDIDGIGYVVGGGVEKAFEKFRIKIEGLYYSFDESEDTSDLNGDSDPGDYAEIKDLWSVRVGLAMPFQ